MGDKRPKVQIVRPDDENVSIYIGGKEVAYAGHDADGFNGMRKVIETARAVAAALGADVEDANESDPQPYTYYVVFTVAIRRRDGFDYMTAVRWMDTPGPIEGPEDTDELRATLAAETGYPVENIRVINFICTDGPS